MKLYDKLLENGDLFIDEEDKERILSLPELQREKILHERFVKIKDNQLTNVLKGLERQEKVVEQKEKPKFEGCDFIVSREMLINNIFKPMVGVLKGTFIRVMINRKYIIAKILGFNTIKPYKLLTKAGEMCTVGLVIDTGSKIIEGIETNSVSSTRITPEEFEVFITDFGIQSLDDLRNKFQKAKEELNRKMSDSEITRTIENRKKDNPRKITNTERKIEIIAKRDEALQNKDKEKARIFQNELEKIEDQEREERKRHLEESETKKRKIWP